MNRKKKILLVTYHGGTGGVAVMVKNLAEFLYRGTDFDVHVCFANSGGPIADQIVAIGVQTYIAELKNGYDLRGMLRIVAYIKKGEFDIVHLHYFTPILRLACIFARCKCLIMTKHMSSFEDKERGQFEVLNSLHRLLRSSVDIYTTVSVDMKREMAREGIAKFENIEVIYNGVDMKKFNCCLYDKVVTLKKYQLPSNKTIVGTVRGLGSEVKGVDHLIYALARIREFNDSVHLVIVGDGPLRASLELLAERYNLQTEVTFLGTQLDVPEVLSFMDVFLLPSKWETFGIAAVEAMAMGKPVVAYAVGGIPEVVVNGVTGILIPHREPNAMANAILGLVGDVRSLVRMGAEGKKIVSERFDIDLCMKKYVETYNKALSGSIL